MNHFSVLKKEAIELLNIKPDGIYLDLTLGRAGHTLEILKKLNDKGLLIGFDLDQTAIKESDELIKKNGFKNYFLVNDNFINFENILEEKNIKKIDGVLLDLGVSSPQFDDPNRGFSYRFNSRLDMRMNKENKLDAYYILNNYKFEDLFRIFKEYGEEKDAFKIAKNIVKQREIKPIETTFELNEVIKNSKSFKELSKKGHPSKQVFQAIRIEVNNELNNLKIVLNKLTNYLNKDGRLVVITFHSLEDRIVKNYFNSLTKVIGNRIDDYKLPDKNKLEFELVNKSIIIASDDEINQNLRSKSAKLRGLRKTV